MQKKRRRKKEKKGKGGEKSPACVGFCKKNVKISEENAVFLLTNRLKNGIILIYIAIFVFVGR